MKSIYIILDIFRKEMTYWGVIWCFLIEIFNCKKLYLKDVFKSLKPTNTEVNGFENDCNKCNI